ncbi:hypothetical protein O181_023405 [Austropuccinia psidii MF-1]|uniref:Uncharacterized protein n=1 Tax=Austropuccinia psidii MF-1 TaxID=1389203 RepID=A0A9Q3CJ24_9BASI|nr:hypothetical protein [Austropuccinia psidii MF-1]
MSRLHQDNVNSHMCHMRMSLKAQTNFNTIHNVWVITPHGATQKFGLLIFVHEKTSSPLPGHLIPLPCLLSCLNWLPHLQRLACLCACTPLQMRLRHCPPISALTTPYASIPLPLTIFTLLQGPQDETTILPSPLLMLLHPRLIFSLAYNPYTLEGPSSYSSDTDLTPPYASLHPPNPIHCLPSLHSWSSFPTCL